MKLYKYPWLTSIASGLLLAFIPFIFFSAYNSPETTSPLLPPLPQLIKSLFEMAFLFFSLGFLLSIVPVFVIGWPLYFVAKKLAIVNLITCSLGGGLVVVLPYLYLYKLGIKFPDLFSKTGIIVICLLFFCGAVSGSIFFILNKINDRMQSDV